ncbi:alpha/beta fold hydrolase [Angustibacter peucedani]
MLHSGVAERRQWDPQVPALAARYRVVRPDLRGFGETPVPDVAWDDVDDVLALFDDLGVEQAAVVGSSFGGRIALELAARAPQRVSRLVLLCAAFGGIEPTPDVREFGAAEDALLEAGDVDGAVDLNVRTWLGPEATDEVRSAVAGWQRRAFELQLAADDDLWGPRPDVDPAAIEVPTTVVAGRHDLELFGQIARHLAAAMPDARLVELDWAGHLPNLERPDDTTDLLLTALDA